MQKRVLCSLIHRGGAIGGTLYIDDMAITYKTNKLTVEQRLKRLVLPILEMQSLTWKRFIFPIATFQMQNGEKYSFIIFNKRKFCQYFQANAGIE